MANVATAVPVTAKQDIGAEEPTMATQAQPAPKPAHLAQKSPSNRGTVAHTFQRYTDRATRLAITTGELAQIAYQQGRTQAVAGYSRAVAKTQELAKRAQIRARQAKQEHPLKLIAFLAGVGFVAGVALRIWRSRVS